MNLREIERQLLEEAKNKDKYLSELVIELEKSMIELSKNNSIFISIKTDGKNETIRNIEKVISVFFQQLNEVEGVFGCSAELGDNGKNGIYNAITEGFQNMKRKESAAEAKKLKNPNYECKELAKKEWNEWGKNESVEHYKKRIIEKCKVDGRTVERWICEFRHI